uniref:Uncharacterized protein n=1 Tax=Parascaris univalens TaxID=6257 RepID=A0A914ZC59_PARUN
SELNVEDLLPELHISIRHLFRTADMIREGGREVIRKFCIHRHWSRFFFEALVDAVKGAIIKHSQFKQQRNSAFFAYFRLQSLIHCHISNGYHSVFPRKIVLWDKSIIILR